MYERLIDHNALVVFGQPVTYFGDVHETLGEAIADQVRRYRRQRDLSVRQLAEECAKIAPGTTLTQGVLTNIERGPESTALRGRREVTVEELLTIAAALRVPPILMICPPTAPDPIPVIPGSRLSAADAKAWINGDAPPNFASGVIEDLAAYHVDFINNARLLQVVGFHERIAAEVERNFYRYRRAMESAAEREHRLADATAQYEHTYTQVGDLMKIKDPTAEQNDRMNALMAASMDFATVRTVADRDVMDARARCQAAHAELLASLEGLNNLRFTMKQLGVPVPTLSDEVEDVALQFDTTPYLQQEKLDFKASDGR